MLTIMTPTYNRAYILPEAYRSLREQSCFDFEWIVVDDGSQDETEQLVRGWAAQCADFRSAIADSPTAASTARSTAACSWRAAHGF